MSGLLLIMMFVLVVAGCSKEEGTSEEEGTSSEEKLKVVASIYPMYEFAQKVGGEHAEVTLLISEGMEPHDWEPAPQDLTLLESADVLVYNGAGIEGWIDQVIGSLDNQNLALVETTHGLELLAAEEGHEHGHDHEEEEEAHEDEEHSHDNDEESHDEEEHSHDHGEFDPHVWLSPIKAIEQVRIIEDAFAEARPEYTDAFKDNANAYIEELEDLNEQYKETLAPYKGKEFVTQHAAFAYLANEYELEQLPIAGLSPHNEPSAERMAEIVEFAEEHGVRTVFFETLVSSKVAKTIAEELGAETSVLHPLEYRTLEDRENGMDYIKLMEQNLNNLKEAFERES